MKIITLLVAILLSTTITAQAVFVDSATGSKIAGAKYIKTLNKYIVKTDSIALRKLHKNAKIQKEKIDTSANLLYDTNTPIEIYQNNYNGDYVVKNNEFLTKKNKIYTGRGVKVLIMDTGLDTLMVPAPYYLDNSTLITNGLPGRGKHGTLVSSIIQSKIGLANDVKMFHIKIWNTDIHGNQVSLTTEANLVQAMQLAIDSAVDIIGISAAWGYMSNFEAMMDAVMANNIIIVASTGNNGAISSISHPASYGSSVTFGNGKATF
jgi:hypothetical protein